MNNEGEQEKLTAEDLLANEGDLLAGLLEAAKAKTTDTVIITLKRGDKVFFRFRVRGMGEDEAKDIKERNSTYRTNSIGIRVLKEFNAVRFRSETIYRATVEEDRVRLWDNREAQQKLNVLSGIDMIDKVLLYGEKDAIYDKIQLVSGFRDEDEVEETVKNS